MKNRKTGSIKTTISAAVVVLTLAVFTELTVCQFGGGGPMGGMEGRGGMRSRDDGQMKKMQEMCDKNPDVCNLMKETMTFCQENGDYCEMGGLPKMQKPSGGMGGPGGGGPGMGGGPGGGGAPPNMGVMGEMMKTCMDGGKECDNLKTEVRGRLDFSKGMKNLCEGKDKEACGLIKEAKTFCTEDKDLCEHGMKGSSEPKYYAEFITECQKEKEKCKAQKTGMQTRLTQLKELKKVCEKDADECDQMKELITTCDEDAEKCEKMKEMRALCKENPDECARLKEQEREVEIQKMKARCDENPDICKSNTEQKRNYCNKNPGECDEETLRMLDEMEKHIAQMGSGSQEIKPGGIEVILEE